MILDSSPAHLIMSLHSLSTPDKPANYCRYTWFWRAHKQRKPHHFFMYRGHWYCVEYGSILGKRVYHSLKWWYYFTGERIT